MSGSDSESGIDSTPHSAVSTPQRHSKNKKPVSKKNVDFSNPKEELQNEMKVQYKAGSQDSTRAKQNQIYAGVQLSPKVLTQKGEGSPIENKDRIAVFSEENYKTQRNYTATNELPPQEDLSEGKSPLHGAIDTAVTHKPLKAGKQTFRWNLIFNLLFWIIVPMPVWVPFVSQTVAWYLIPAVQAVFVFMWVVVVTLACKNMIVLYMNKNKDFREDYPDYIEIRHLVVISCYKEPVELIARSVQTLADQTEVGRISMLISFEEKTPEVQTKCDKLREIFKDAGFERLILNIHPFGLPNEIPGKCSNVNHGLRQATQVMQEELGAYFDAEKIIVTNSDADTHFHPSYIAALTSKFIKEKTPHGVIFQAPLFYNWGLDGSSFVTRVTGLLRTTLMMGALIPFNINSMSIFSFSLRLCIDGNFGHPAYQMEDIICLIRWMGITRRRLRIPMIPVPVISGPTSGETVELEVAEWARQARRWTIGAAEVFHYYVMKAGRMPFWPAFSWGLCFLSYYGVLLCSGGLYGISAGLSMAFLVKDAPFYINYAMYGLAGLQQLAFLWVFMMDVFGPRLMKVKEHISFVRNFLHFLLTPLVLLGYSLVEFYALHEVAVRGKEVCKHGASKKSALGVVSSTV
ncbi:uncharacterized protein LOC106153447 [Lingula anatina]|uniref:Uncharacterized protein LOC106153447 n=1 Tax=Lingula anatina TaxID=7574 RepID=A0A1S3H9R4_LINAN|nr:uncharacterized protein LOC106153447 [Lingula anatina]|eukprot:XP_013382840.1 uncharacterized protein LOC106153447 [Lingula anatina]